MDVQYADRLEAGGKLARALEQYRDTDAMLLGLARGGVEVAYAVAEALRLPLQAFVVRKVGAPLQPELALGAVSETGRSWLEPERIEEVGASPWYVEQEVARKRKEAEERKQQYAIGPGLEAVRGRPVILIDDGIATGATALVAAQSVRDLGASKVILATPVAPPQAVPALQLYVDELVVLATPSLFFAIGQFYRDFEQVSDEEVIHYLRLAQGREGSGMPASAAPPLRA